MKLELDKKDKIATITLQHINDLFYLYLLIERDDEVLGWTFRQKKVSNAGQQIRGEKERVYLGIKVNKVYFHPLLIP
jgi:Predicted RNA-binding proteins